MHKDYRTTSTLDCEGNDLSIICSLMPVPDFTQPSQASFENLADS